MIGGVWVFNRLRPVIPDIGALMLIVVVVTMIVAFVIGAACMRISPRERFVDVESPSVEDIAARVDALEKEACDLITRTDQFIQNDVGKPGQDDPSLITAAQQKARAALPGPITDCPSTATALQGLSAEIVSDLENRVTRLETTLTKFTLPELQRTYDTSVKCETFVDVTATVDPMSALVARVDALETAVTDQKTKLLKPIDDKTAALQRGELSDCDRKKGGKTAMATSIKMPAGSVTGV